jgi:hypothetical protein
MANLLDQSRSMASETARRTAWATTRAGLILALALAIAPNRAQASQILNVPADFSSIQAAINAAAPGDTVNVAPGTYTEQIDFLGKAITVRGTGGAAVTTISGGGVLGPMVSLVNNEGAGTRLEGFKITGGLVTVADGAGIRIVGSSPTIADCVIADNDGVVNCSGCFTRGGGASVVGGSPTFLRVTFDRNEVGGFGRPQGGALYAGIFSQVTITDCLFTRNSVMFRDGGALFIEGGTVTVTGTTFRENSCTSCAGGAIRLEAGALSIDSSRFERNLSEGGAGGAISAFFSTGLTVSNTVFDRNDGDGGGAGAIDIANGDLTITNCTFTDQISASVSNSGDVVRATNANVTVTGSTFSRGAATPGYDAFAFFMTGGSLNVDDCTFRSDGAGAMSIFATNSPVTVTDSTWRDSDWSDGAGAAANIRGGQITFARNSFTNMRGGSLRLEQGATGTVSECTFVDSDYEGGSGGGIGVATGSVVAVSNCTFSGCDAPGGAGGAISFTANTGGSIRNVQVTAGGAPGGSGAGINVDTSSPFIIEDVTINDATVPDGFGGAVALLRVRNSIDMVIRRVALTNAPSRALQIDAGVVRVEDSVIRGSGLDPESSAGGVLINSGASFTFDRCRIEDCDAFGGSGGAMSISGTANGVVRNTVFLRNGRRPGGDFDQFTSGGAISASGTSSTQFINCVFARNGNFQGTIRATTNASISLSNCTLADNALTEPPMGSTTRSVLFANSSTAGNPATISVLNSIVRGDLTNGQFILRFLGTNAALNATYSNIEGGFAGQGNIADAPLFLSPAANDYRLLAGSPGIDAGSNPGVPSGLTLDLAGNPRFVDDATIADTGVGPAPVIDMGAFEGAAAGCDAIDFNNDGVFPDLNDVITFLDVFGGTPCPTCNDIDFNNDGVFPDLVDVVKFFDVFAGGNC